MKIRNELLTSTLFVILGSIIGKILTLVSQVYLARELSIESFSYYATVLGIVSISIWMKNGAIIQVAIKEQIEKGDISSCKNWARILNSLAFIVILIVSLFFYEKKQIFYLLVAFSFNVLISHYGLINRVIFIANNKYDALLKYEVAFSIVYTMSCISGAMILKDERAFVCGLLSTSFYEFIVCNRLKLHKTPFSIKNTIVKMFPVGKWLLLGSLGATLVMQGAYLALKDQSHEIIAGFYFSFQLVTAFSLLLGESIRKVIMPFYLVNKDKFGLYKNGVLYTSCFCIMLTTISAPFIDPVVGLLWDGKWDYAIEIIELFYITAFLSLTISLAYAKLESINKFKLRSILQITDGVFLLASVLFSLKSNDLFFIASAVVLRRLIFGLVQIYSPFYCCKELGFFKLVGWVYILFIYSLIAFYLTKSVNSNLEYGYLYSSFYIFTSYLVLILITRFFKLDKRITL